MLIAELNMQYRTHYFEVLIHDVMDISVYFLITQQDNTSPLQLTLSVALIGFFN